MSAAGTERRAAAGTPPAATTHLPASRTPAGADGAPLRVDRPSWWPGSPDDAALERTVRDAGGTPVLGAEVVVGGRALVEVTFLWEDVAAADGPATGPEVMVHLNSLTDRHREDVSGAILERVPGTRWHALTYLLDPASILGYTVVVRPEIARDAGATRPGWVAVHEDGRPDPRCPAPLATARGGASLWAGPRSRTHREWDAPRPVGSPGWAHRLEIGDAERRLTLVTGTAQDPHAPAPRLLVLLDGEMWRSHDVVPRLADRAGALDLLILDSIGHPERARDLPDPERCARILEDALRAARTAAGAEWSAADVIVAGQSFGGLAAAETVLRRPDLAALGIAQSGSYWFGSDQAPGTGRGALLRWLEEAVAESPERLTGRLVVQVGAEEGDMVDGSAELVERLRPTEVVLAHVVWQGGHDYAWWRHGLSAALDRLDELDAHRERVTAP
jgi:enterochelin esterase family protein